MKLSRSFGCMPLHEGTVLVSGIFQGKTSLLQSMIDLSIITFTCCSEWTVITSGHGVKLLSLVNHIPMGTRFVLNSSYFFPKHCTSESLGSNISWEQTTYGLMLTYVGGLELMNLC